MRQYLVAVDVGTGSARAGVFDRNGIMLSRTTHPIIMHRPRENHAEHDSEDIWNAVCLSVRGALAQAAIPAQSVAAIGFDATCSLVARGKSGEQVSVSTSGEDRFDTIVWLDHRGIAEADFLTASGHPVLDFAGGSISPEMQMPKLMWLKKHLPQSWARSGHFFDLADFLTWKATGSTARSNCTLTAKWNFLAHEQQGWRRDYLELAGISDLLQQGSLPDVTVEPGKAIAPLSEKAAQELGLDTGCQVAAGMIDAYAGALGALGGSLSADVGRNVALIAGTSSCLVVLTPQQMQGHSLWGPYWQAVLSGHWLVEGGQSATGALLDHIVRMHPAGGEPDAALHGRIVKRVQALRETEGEAFASRLHVLPDFHGNRSPLADPHARGVISGLTLDTSFDSLCALYWRTAVSIALSTRHVLEAMEGFGYETSTLHVAGGHIHNPLLMELYADVTGRRVVVPRTSDAVLLGTAMNAASAGHVHKSLVEAGTAMYPGFEELAPNVERAKIYERDYKRFLAMYQHREELDQI
ncbi:FGGY-family carbohydrate kinase [Agrobacterium larrymoorei]|uniref:FGGY-family carbohydrate kinase n=1 Tax=Agrobacterium larrymoorei TaxID=160699 RepID=A0A4D7DZ00_9HYPH|nr:FGGY-family carbohydrate kinase [Agrobacterium larrymoorei]QCJ00130.1 ribulokinase [Agrobacterium larrymoorei]QYA09427.1 FGGY-family carbohydrate kinase [Agrobacterium larrymoorei]